jgi:hypothetical protein
MYNDKYEFYLKRKSQEFKLALSYVYENNKINKTENNENIIRYNLSKYYLDTIKTNSLSKDKYCKWIRTLKKSQPEDIEYLYLNIN